MGPPGSGRDASQRETAAGRDANGREGPGGGRSATSTAAGRGIESGDEEEERRGVRAPGLGTLKLETFAGGRNPMALRDWKTQVEAVRLLSGLEESKLALYAWMSLRG